MNEINIDRIGNDLAAAYQDGYNDGYKDGYKDGLKDTHDTEIQESTTRVNEF